MRTVLSALLVATRGKEGCGVDCHERSREGGVRSDIRDVFHISSVSSSNELKEGVLRWWWWSSSCGWFFLRCQVD
jgi:hypothetical protein